MNIKAQLAVVAVLSCLAVTAGVLGAWVVGDWRLAALGRDVVPMAPVTAALLMLAGAAILTELAGQGTRLARVVTQGAAGVIAVAAGLVLLQNLTEFKLPWDGWVPEDDWQGMPVGQMAPHSAATFFLLAAGLVAFGRSRAGSERAQRWLTGFAVGGFLSAFLAVLAYAAGTPLQSGGRLVPMAQSTALVFAALQAALLLAGKPRQSRQDKETVAGLRLAAGLLAGTVGVSAFVVLAGFFYIRSQETLEREKVRDHLEAIASLKAAQVRAWREERMGEGRFLARTPAVLADVAALVQQPQDTAARSRVQNWLEPIKGGDRYLSVVVLTPAGEVRLALPGEAAGSFRARGADLGTARRARGPLLSELYRDGQDGRVRLDLLVPMRQEKNSEEIVAVVVLRLDVAKSLFAFLRDWPTPSDSAESFLVRRDGESVLFLSELRHRPAAALALRLPMDTPALTAAAALRGARGLIVGRDYRGVRVLGTSRDVPGTDWKLVTKMDEDEAYHGLRTEAAQTLALMGLILTVVGLVALAVWRQRRSEALERTLVLTREREALASKFALVMRHANDAIMVLDSDGRILEVNERAREAYGYTEAELKALEPGGLRAPDAEDAWARDRELLRTETGGRFETVHRRKDGTVFPVEVSGRAVEIGGRAVIFAIYRDVTELRRHEREMERTNRLYAALSQVNQAIVRATAPDELLREMCRVLVEFGRFRMVWVGKVDATSREIVLLAAHGAALDYLAGLSISTDASRPEGLGPSGVAARENHTDVCDDIEREERMAPWRDAARRAGYRSSAALPFGLDPDTRGILTVYAAEPEFFGAREVALLEEAAQDLEFGLVNLARERQRRAAEQALEAKHTELQGAMAQVQEYRAMLQRVLESIPVRVFWKDRDGRYLGCNALFARDAGLQRPAEITGRTDADLVWHQQASLYTADDRMVMESGEARLNIVEPQTTPAGTTLWLSTSKVPLRRADGTVFGVLGVYEDITQRREADEALRKSLREKEALLKEVHHRVKNNLQVIASLLRLEAGRRDEAATVAALREMQGRIRSMALLHETLYRSGNFAGVELASYLRQLATQLFRAQNDRGGAVALRLELEPATLEIDRAIPCGLIVNELLTNCLKHAFPEARAGEICVRLRAAPEARLELGVGDTGVGLPADWDRRDARSLGLKLVEDLARQLGGVMTVRTGPGTDIAISFATLKPNRPD